MKSIPVLLLLLAVLSVRAQENGTPGFLSDTSRVVILQYDSSYTISLSKEKIMLAEKVLNAALEKEFPLPVPKENTGKKQKKQKRFDIKRYHIQPVPRLNIHGELEIWVNCFCPLFFKFDWRKHIFSRAMVADGGSCFFELVINLDTQQYDHFGMNGVG